MSENSLATRIESRIDKAVSANTGLTPTGSMAFSSVEQIMEFAKVMAIAGVAVPKHLRENVGACLAVAIQASEWQMSPFAVASKTYVVNDRIAFEAQLVNAVILKRAPITGRFKISYSGEGGTRRCTVSVTLNDGEVVDYQSPTFASIPVKNSPLWKSDPDQQLFYYSSRAMCRRHFPDVLLGIYTPDEVLDGIDGAIEVQAMPSARVGTRQATPIEDAQPARQAKPKPAAPPEPEAEHAYTPREHPTEVYQEGGDEQSTAEEPAPTDEPSLAPSAADLKKAIIARMADLNIGKLALNKHLIALGWLESGQSFETASAKQLADFLDGWEQIVDRIKNA